MTDQFINRSALTENFTVFPNALLNDDRLTGEGLALMVYLLSKPSSWQLSPTNIRKRFKWGKDKAYKVINGLIECGYIIKEAQRDGGKFNAQFLILSMIRLKFHHFLKNRKRKNRTRQIRTL